MKKLHSAVPCPILFSLQLLNFISDFTPTVHVLFIDIFVVMFYVFCLLLCIYSVVVYIIGLVCVIICLFSVCVLICLCLHIFM